jgi:hypothetical protein
MQKTDERPYTIVQLTSDQFDESYRPIPAHDGSNMRPLDWTPEMEAAHRECRVWTAVDGDNGELILMSGWHFVNRFGYIVTERPYDPLILYEVEIAGPGACVMCDGPIPAEYESGTYCSDKCWEADV